MPALPPGRLTGVANRLRRGLARAHRGTAPPPLRVLEALFARFDAAALRALCDLGVPDALDGPATAVDLARRTDADVDDLARLLRYGAARGFVRRRRDGRFAPTGVTRSLRTDGAVAWRAWVEFASDPAIDEAWSHLANGVRSAQPAFALAHGAPFFDHLATAAPALHSTFDDAMAAGATLQALGLVRTLDWSGVRSVCDVGGGTGAALHVVLHAVEGLQGTLFDRPEVVARARPAPGDGESRRVVGGDFFHEVPSGRDRYLLLAVIHDWSDDEARQLLSNVRRAMTPTSRAVVVETPLAERPRDDFATASDLLMLVLSSGRERTDTHYRELFASAGLRVAEVSPLPTGATAYELVAHDV